MKTVAATMLIVSVSSAALAQSYTPYFNAEEQERFDRITAPFLAGEVPPMDPSNLQSTKECELAPEAAEWWRQKRAGEMKPGENHRINIYHYNRNLNVLETRDCSCEGSTPPADHTIALYDALPVSESMGWKIGSEFFEDKKQGVAQRLVVEFCGGRF